MSRPRTSALARLVAGVAAITLGTALCACSDIYFARRDSVSLSAGDAIAANAAQEVVDPWPPESGNTRLAANGQKMQGAVERYRTNKVTPPVDPQAPQNANNAVAQTINQNGGGTLPQTSTTNISVVGSQPPTTTSSSQ